MGRGRGGFSTNVHLATDGGGLPQAALVTAVRGPESWRLEAAVEAVTLTAMARDRKVKTAG